MLKKKNLMKSDIDKQVVKKALRNEGYGIH